MISALFDGSNYSLHVTITNQKQAVNRFNRIKRFNLNCRL